ncbi:SpoIIE family protein phosphatase [Paracidobacterium acidisoli]|uniref:PPM-type phosphatase domain-containing protein n=1 Tax=Paracidobacterium acidisoli TaxID=2303751 RepID=A0A372IMZ4_9BACT|nr:SpoIIE family protein phosphatase [Paracidobacterium acidisoli]
MKPKRFSPNLLRALLGLYIVASVSYWVAGAVDAWQMTVHWDQRVRAPLVYDDDSHVISTVEKEAATAGVTKGDRIEGLNGTPYSGEAQWDAVLAEDHPGDTVDVELQLPNGSLRSATITLTRITPYWLGTSSVLRYWEQFLIIGFLPLACLAIGYWVVLVKPMERNAWLLLILLTFPSVLFVNPGLATGTPLLLRTFWYQLMQYLGSPTLLLFGIYFPERSRIDTRLPWLKWLILGPLALAGIFLFPYLYSGYFLAGAGPHLARAANVIGSTINFLNLLCVILYLVLTLDKLRSASTEDARRRLRVLTTGMSLGMGALLIVFVLLPHFGISGHDRKYYWLQWLGAVLFMFAPLTLAYVVLVQRAMDVRVLLRMGTRYALARATLWVLQAALLAAVGVLLLLPALHKRQPQPFDIFGVIVFGALLLALRLGVQKRLQHWLDRKFFREAFDAEQMLNDLSDEVRRFTETQPLLETVARRIADTLHIDQIALLLRRGEYFQLQQSIGVSGGGTLTLPAQSSAVRFMVNSNEPARLYRNDPDAWYLMAGTAERRALDMLNAELLLPLPGRNRLMGVMALGPRRSEAAYSGSDLKILQAVASQTGLALEISELAHSLASEAAQRERFNREMEIAREVQERLFPQYMPEIPGATLAGECRPALGVGGDYYDVIDLGDGRVGLAVGDVSGKGISAALLMASLRASLRGITLDNPRDFANLMHKVNRLVYEASASNRYATFFFASYDPKTRRLECVNAGHNPPVLLRGAQAIRLETGGPVVGLLPTAPYTEQSLTLEPGDLLLLYTDGISEAMTHDQEEWEEERMIAAARSATGKSACDVMRAIFHAVDAFTAGAPQHDDMTMLVLKLEEGGS